MKKFKVCVYAICKNEEKFIKRWLDSIKQADYICVLDTGSTDNSVNLLKENGVIVEQKIISPWRFDKARNESLKLIPKDTDICVCVDIDEVFQKGWYELLQKNWNKNLTQIQYSYTWNFNSDGSEGIKFLYEKIHSYNEFEWIYPVHEILHYTGKRPQNTLCVPEIKLHHHADETKSRTQYLPLLELSVKEYPESDRNTHYLGREYMFNGDYEKAITTLKNHLKLKTATWIDERSASLRYIALCYKFLNKKSLAEKFFKRAIIEAPHLRENYYELGIFYYENKRYLDCCYILLSMLNITKRNLSYISSPLCWDESTFDYLSLCFYYLKDKQNAILYAKKALNSKPNDERLQLNLKFFEQM